MIVVLICLSLTLIVFGWVFYEIYLDKIGKNYDPEQEKIDRQKKLEDKIEKAVREVKGRKKL